MKSKPPKKRIETGTWSAEVVVKGAKSKKVLDKKSVEGKLKDLEDRYQETADRMGVSLATVMKTLPRGGISLEAKSAEDFKSVGVRVWLEQTFPDFDPGTAEEMYHDMAEKVDYILDDAFQQARSSFDSKTEE